MSTPTGLEPALATNSPEESTAPTETPSTQTPDSEKTTLESMTPEQLRAYVKNLRAENAGHRTKLNQFEQAEEERRQAQLTEHQKAEERASKAEEQVTAMQSRIDQAELKAAAQAVGIIDPEAAVRLLDASKIERDDDGQIKNAGDLMKALAEEKKYLRAVEPVTAPRTNRTNSHSSNALPTFTQAQIADRKFYKEHRADIEKALREGRVTD